MQSGVGEIAKTKENKANNCNTYTHAQAHRLKKMRFDQFVDSFNPETNKKNRTNEIRANHEDG